MLEDESQGTSLGMEFTMSSQIFGIRMYGDINGNFDTSYFGPFDEIMVSPTLCQGSELAIRSPVTERSSPG